MKITPEQSLCKTSFWAFAHRMKWGAPDNARNGKSLHAGMAGNERGADMIRDFIGFGLFMTALLYGGPWVYYVLTGDYLKF